MRRILIIQLADIGDLVLTTPALSALRSAHPEARIIVLTSPHAAPILDGTGLADRVITFDKRVFESFGALLRPRNLWSLAHLLLTLRRLHPDSVLIPRHLSTRAGALKLALLAFASGARIRAGLDNGRGWFLTHKLPDAGFGARHEADYALQIAALVGADPAPRPLTVATASPDHLLPAKTRTRIAIHAGSGGYAPARRWDAERFAAVADRLRVQHNAEIVIVGAAGDDSARVMATLDSRDGVIDLSGKTTLAELAGVLATCDLFIGADSGVMHSAAAVGAHVIALFGPSNHQAWRPYTDRATVIRSAPECSPCAYVGSGVGARHGCAARTCMRMITVEQVIASIGGMHAPPLQTKPSPTITPTIRILDLPVSAITFDGWIALIAAWMQSDQPHHVCTINPEMIMIARRDPVFHVVLSRADLTVPDGIGLLWAARYIGSPLPERVTGSDGVPLIAAAAAQQGWRIFLLGAAPGVADQAARVLIERHPTLRIVGTFSGSPLPAEEDDLVARVNAANADILFVAYGAPEQDKWIARNLPRLRVRMAMGVGGSLDFIAGVIPRAPLAWQKLGLEWLYRLYLQPWRIGRMLRLPRFVIAVLLHGRRHGRRHRKQDQA